VGVGRMDDVGLDHEVFVDELSPVGAVGTYAADFGRGQHHVIWFFPVKIILHIFLPDEVQLCVGFSDDVCVAFGGEAAVDGGTHHAFVAGYVDLRYWVLGTGYWTGAEEFIHFLALINFVNIFPIILHSVWMPVNCSREI